MPVAVGYAGVRDQWLVNTRSLRVLAAVVRCRASVRRVGGKGLRSTNRTSWAGLRADYHTGWTAEEALWASTRGLLVL